MNLSKKEFDYFLYRFYKDLKLEMSFEDFKVVCANYGWLFKEVIK